MRAGALPVPEQTCSLLSSTNMETLRQALQQPRSKNTASPRGADTGLIQTLCPARHSAQPDTLLSQTLCSVRHSTQPDTLLSQTVRTQQAHEEHYRVQPNPSQKLLPLVCQMPPGQPAKLCKVSHSTLSHTVSPCCFTLRRFLVTSLSLAPLHPLSIILPCLLHTLLSVSHLHSLSLSRCANLLGFFFGEQHFHSRPVLTCSTCSSSVAQSCHSLPLYSLLTAHSHCSLLTLTAHPLYHLPAATTTVSLSISASHSSLSSTLSLSLSLSLIPSLRTCSAISSSARCARKSLSDPDDIGACRTNNVSQPSAPVSWGRGRAGTR